MRRPSLPAYLQTPLLYALFGAIWILLSDYALAALVQDPAQLTAIQSWKGWAFVAASALLIFVQLQRASRHRQQLEAEIVGARDHLASVLDSLNDALITVDEGWRVVYANPATARLRGEYAGSLVGQSLWDLRSDLRDQPPARALERAMQQRTVEQFELHYHLPGGSHHIVDVRAIPIAGGLTIAAHDVSERRIAERALMRSNRVLTMLSACNQTLIHAESEQALLDNVCRICVEQGGYRMAWVGFAQRDERSSVRPVAQTGFESGYLESANISWADTPQGRGPTGTAIRQRRIALSRNISEDPNFAPWRAAAAERGYASVVALPLAAGGDLIGALTIYAAEPDAFDTTELQLLRELADDLAFGVVTLRVRAERAQLDEQLRTSQALIERVIETVPDGIVAIDQAGSITLANPAAEQLLGLAQGQRQPPPPAIVPILDMARSSSSGSAEQLVDLPDAAQHVIAYRVAPLHDSSGRRAGAVATLSDVTERRRAEESALRRMLELDTLQRVTIALRTAQTQEAMLPLLLDQALAVLMLVDGGIWIYDELGQGLRAAVTRGWVEQLRETLIPPGVSIIGQVFSRGDTVDPRTLADDPLADFPEAIPPLGWGGICMPLHADSLAVAVLMVATPAGRSLAREERQLLASLAEIGGSTLHRLRLHQETERRLKHLQALRGIDHAINASMDPQVILSLLLDAVVSQLGADAAGILLLNPMRLTLEYAAGVGFRTPLYERSRLRVGEGLAGRAALIRQRVQSANLRADPEFLRSELVQAEGYVGYLALPFVAKGQLKGVLEVFSRHSFVADVEWVEFLDALANQAAIAIDNMQLYEGLQRSNIELKLAYDTTIEGWARAIELRDREPEGHAQRIADLTVRLGRAAGMSEAQLVHLRRGALLHDVGMIAVPSEILVKTSALSPEELAIMREHPRLAQQLIEPIAYLRPAIDIPVSHHERWDGSGYPGGLRGEQIPLAARLFAVVDVWDALRSERPHRPALREAEARAYLQSQAGVLFDPHAVRLLIDALPPTEGDD